MTHRLLISCLLAAISSTSMLAAGAEGAKTHDTALHYTFDTLDGQALGDTSKHNRTGTLHGINPNDLVPGHEGNALRFNGISSYVVIDNANDLSFDQQDFSISLWFKPGKAEGTLLSMLTNRTSSYGRYQVLLTQGVIKAIWSPADSSTYQSIVSTTPLAMDQWCHLVIVFDRAQKQVSLYLNGVLDQTGPWTGDTRGSANQGFYLGAHAGKEVLPSYEGLMDNLQIVNTAMTSQDVQAQWQQPLQAEQAKSAWAGSDVMGFVVPAISSTRWLANVMPDPSTISSTIAMTAAKGEFESASFILHAVKDTAKLEVAVSDLKGQKTGKSIASSQVDLRVVKRWYQSGNAWDGYPLQNFSRRVLVPELLLRDENMVRVDHKTQDNFVRLDKAEGPEYVSVSYKNKGDYQKPFGVKHLGPIEFNYATEPVSDAKTLQPVLMNAGENKQFWITLHVPQDAAADRYTGKLTLSASGKKLGEMTLDLRVLPYELPLPRTYYDVNRDYYLHGKHHVRLIIEQALTQSDEIATQRVSTMFKNMADHGIFEMTGPFLYPGFTEEDAKTFAREMKMVREAGLAKRMVVAGDAGPIQWWKKPKDEADAQKRIKDFQDKIDTALRLVKEATDKDPQDIYFYGTDEATGSHLTMQLPSWKYIQSKGAKVFTSGWQENIRTTAFSQDIHSQAGKPNPEDAAKWHALGNKISTYAYPFSGPENPQLWRRNAGMLTYKANYDGFMLYIYFEGSMSNIWNDFLPSQYRGLNMVYPVKDGVIDTIAWEGFREGVDDVRYATLMKQLAAKAIASPSVDVRHLGKRALQWLALLDSETADLDTARLEMINHIDQLRQALGEGE